MRLKKPCPVHRGHIAMSGSSGQTLVTAMIGFRYIVSKSADWPLTESALPILGERSPIRKLPNRAAQYLALQRRTTSRTEPRPRRGRLPAAPAGL